MKNNEEKNNKVTIGEKLEHFWFRHKYEIKDAATFGVSVVLIGGIAYMCTGIGRRFGELEANNSNLIKEIKQQAMNTTCDNLVQFVIDKGEEGLSFSRTVAVDGKDVVEHVKLFAGEITRD